MSGWTEFQVNADQLGIIRKTTSPLNKNALAAGFQFTEFSAPNGVTVKLEIDNFYDDTVRNKQLDRNGHPAMSSRFDIMYIGTTDQPNIFRCGIKGRPEYRGLKERKDILVVLFKSGKIGKNLPKFLVNIK